MTFKHGFGFGVCALAITLVLGFGFGIDMGSSSGSELKLTYGLPVVASSADSSNFVDLESKIHQEANDRDAIKAMPPAKPVRPVRDTISREYRVTDKSNTRAIGLEICRTQWNEEDCQSLDWIIQHESGWNQYATNKNCCGLFQRLNRCSEIILSDFNGQMVEGMDYVVGRYGSAGKAKAFWERNHWY